MTRINGKNKGNSFERKIANLLSKRFSVRTGIEQSFIRNPDSGSFFGGSNQKRTNTHDLEMAVFGDLKCPKSFKFTIECKHYKSPPSFQSLVKGAVTQWDQWISQASQDSVNSGKKFLLIVKYNNVEEIVFTEDELLPSALFKYKEKNVYRLVDILSLDDSIFFD